tara:strand:+ start:76 stop:234 length:159 start_codon:yes stop_codon:yes gene_type:complete
MDILLYSYCQTFHLNPEEAKNTPIKTIQKFMQIHGAVKEIESDEIKKVQRKG